MKIKQNKLSEEQILLDKYNHTMSCINKMTAFYRKNAHRVAKDYLNINLKIFQKIIIYQMCTNRYTMYVAARGQGKSFLIALFCVIMCILYPGIQIIIVSKTKGQANEIITKILDELCLKHDWGSANLRSEINIKESSSSANSAKVLFYNASSIKVAASNDNSRHFRANIIVNDEFVKISLNIINNVIRRFLTAPRDAPYTANPKYKDFVEPNREVYASSAWWKNHWSFIKMKSYLANMLAGLDFFVCNLPYQLSLMEGLLLRPQIEAEMTESTFDPLSFEIEMECKWFGDNKQSFFKYTDIVKRCYLTDYYPDLDELNKKQKVEIPERKFNQRRILSVDVALISSNKTNNDAASIMLNDAIPNKNNIYYANIKFIKSREGLTTDELGLLIMRYYYQFKCTDIVLDVNGNGLGVYDFIIKDQFDSETGELYPALSCCNNKEYEGRCKVQNADKVIWVIKASDSFNTLMSTRLRSGFQNGYINLLKLKYDGEEYIRSKVSNFDSLPAQKQKDYLCQFVETDLLVHELIGLTHEVRGTNIKIKETSGARKDRYSSLGYNYFIMKEIEINSRPLSDDNDFSFSFKAPNIYAD